MLRLGLLITLVLLVMSAGWVVAQDETLVEVERLTVEVLAEYPHDTGAFTQGLLYHEGLLYESTGQRGRSTIREVDLETGEILRGYRLEDAFFAEGLALHNDELFQITWQSGVAFVYDLETLARKAIFYYGGEGWGLCSDGELLYMTDGSSTLYVREPSRFSVIEEMTVMLNGAPVMQLNELECVGDEIYANIWHSREIMRIDKATGTVTGVIDANPLMPQEAWDALLNENAQAVLNGIAYNADEDIFYLTGKLWPSLYAVRFVGVE